MSGVLFNVLLSCALLLALLLFALNQSTEFDVPLATVLNCLVIYLITCYIYCRYSENLTTNSFEIGENVYDALWYEMSMKYQKAMLLMIGRAQKEFRLTGLGMVNCSLGVFLAVRILNY